MISWLSPGARPRICRRLWALSDFDHRLILSLRKVFGCHAFGTKLMGTYVQMTERSPFLSGAMAPAPDARPVVAYDDGSSLQREPLGSRIGLASAPSGECLFADLLCEYGRQRSAHAARVGSGKIGRTDQSIGGAGAALIGSQRLALPFRRLAVIPDDPGARDGDLGRAECAGQRLHPMAMPMADNRLVRVISRRRLRPPPITRPRQRGLQLFFDHRFDKAPHLRAQRCLDRIEPIVEKSFVGHSAAVFVLSLFTA